MKNATFNFMKHSIEQEKKALEQLLEIMESTPYEKALKFLLDSSLTITSACGSSGFTTKKFAHSLCCVECPAKFVPPKRSGARWYGCFKGR